ncbi:hypothetical protein [Pantoea sp. 18069]|nr:hypothetical protein [Pantoea sp. 18069]
MGGDFRHVDIFFQKMIVRAGSPCIAYAMAPQPACALVLAFSGHY